MADEKNQDDDRLVFESTMKALQADIATVGVHLTIDSEVRRAYAKQIQLMSSELKIKATAGTITWRQAAQQAQQTRNLIMKITRTKSTPVGLAIAQRLKREGKTFDQLVGLKSKSLYGSGTGFQNLSKSQQNAVFADIVKSAGKSNPSVTASMRKLSSAGRGLIIISLAVSVYTVIEAENKTAAATKELAITGAGIGGGIAGGALAGLACGPGAPVCVTVGAFVGGTLAAFGVSFIW